MRHSIPRKSRRVPLSTRVHLKLEDLPDPVEALTLNVSLGGFSVAVPSPAEVGSLVAFEFEVGNALVEGTGEVAWSRPDTEDPERPIGMGVRYRYLSPGSRERIFRLVQWYAAQPDDLESSAVVAAAAKLPTSTAREFTPAPSGEPSTETPARPSAPRLAPAASPPPPAAPAWPAPPRPTAAVPRTSWPAPASPAPDVAPLSPRAPIVATPAQPASPTARPNIWDRPAPAASPAPEPAREPASAAARPAPGSRDPSVLLIDDLAPEPATTSPPAPFRGAGYASSSGSGRWAKIIGWLLLALLAIAALFAWAPVLERLGLRAATEAPSTAPAVMPETAAVPAEPTPPEVKPGQTLAEDLGVGATPEASPTRSPGETGGGEESAEAASVPNETSSAETALASAPLPAAAAEPAREEPRAVPEPPAPVRPARSLEEIRWSAAGAAGLRVVLRLDGSVDRQAVASSRLGGDNPRLLLSIRGITARRVQPRLAVSSPEVVAIRTGLHQGNEGDRLHVVFDLASPRVDVASLDVDGNTISVVLRRS